MSATAIMKPEPVPARALFKGERPYHHYRFLCITHPKYGPGPVYVAAFPENLICRPATNNGPSGKKAPVQYRYIDQKNQIDILVPFTLHAPTMKTPYGVGTYQPKNAPPPPPDKPVERQKYSLKLSFESKDGAVSAFYELQVDIDDVVQTWIRDHGNDWYPNVPDPFVMGATKVPKIDYISGLYRTLSRPTVSTNQTTGQSYVGPPQLSLSVPQQRGGTFPPALAFDMTRAEISPLAVTADCQVKCIFTMKHVYLMADKLGWTTDLVQVMKMAEGKITTCIMEPYDDALMADIEAAQHVDWDNQNPKP